MTNPPIKELTFLGKKVTVIIDRPLGSKHPEFDDLKYTLNYGFIPNTLGGDGEEIDAYIIGENSPLKTFEGIVKGIIVRHNDNENKLVVTSREYELSELEIKQSTHYQEKYFDIQILLIEE